MCDPADIMDTYIRGTGTIVETQKPVKSSELLQRAK
jgi:hypothetical protein